MSAPSDPNGVTGRLATWIHDLSWDDVPAHVRDRAAHLHVAMRRLWARDHPWRPAPDSLLQGLANDAQLAARVVLPDFVAHNADVY
jgi:hypothetical protein